MSGAQGLFLSDAGQNVYVLRHDPLISVAQFISAPNDCFDLQDPHTLSKQVVRLSRLYLGCYDDEVSALSCFSPDLARSWVELYSAWLHLSNIHIIVCGEFHWAWIYFGT